MKDVPYRVWRTYGVAVAGRTYQVATKPGAFANGRIDPATTLLAEHVEVKQGDTMVQLNCGGGLVGAVAALAGGAGRVLLTDRNIVSVEAATRTLAANRVSNGEVFLGHGANALPAGTNAGAVAIRVPQERIALLQLLADAFRMLEVGGRCYIAGATNEGIKTAANTIETLFGNARVLSRDSSHRVVSAVKRTVEPASDDGLDNPYLNTDTFHELRATLRGTPLTLYSRPGVFSWDHLDEATAILADAMQVHPEIGRAHV